MPRKGLGICLNRSLFLRRVLVWANPGGFNQVSTDHAQTMASRFATICLFILVAFATGSEARAAFIPPDFGFGRCEDSCSAVVLEDPASRIEDRSEVLETPNTPGEPNSRFYSRTGRGMSTTSTSVPTWLSATGVAVPTKQVRIMGESLVLRCEREGKCELPSPHLDGVFRPPRAKLESESTFTPSLSSPLKALSRCVLHQKPSQPSL